jgi:protein involved in polysaccharide export with SLBB domain
LASTVTNASGAAAAGEVFYPVIGMLNAADADTELTVNWIEVGEVI